MTKHQKASPESQSICDLLLSLLIQSLASSTRKEGDNMCSVGVTTRFAYVYHRRNGVRVYLRGTEEDGPFLETLAQKTDVFTVTKRRTMGSAWARQSPYFLDIDSKVGVREAIPLVLYAAGKVSNVKAAKVYLYPSEETDRELTEGSRTTVEVSRVERDRTARKQCIALFGTTCLVCGFNFKSAFGNIGEGFIHVHHLNPLAMATGSRKVDPETDLRPVCPNCHEMLHRQRPPFTIEELKAIFLRHRESTPEPH